ncbi:MetQ/NlpA family ABC transporter substrate-binding protein [Basilea psittacipulmonis]|uniref:Methionine ABC transporter substrate-binding protein n=1 Tax=Basilea psittacipulmonis DSM 24701 TaxID=1072685 RepID=A0A077DJS8_9BURK|nr:MetQ/NlpA family ABC transporter substrate-binding protein [Basilea psittacipulmonis]AIL33348.1 methionine ABC transporter substrate-binding protein [Basilea psittacipulmonis DSM 24701]
MILNKFLAALGLVALVATAQAGETLVVGASPVPHAKILEHVKPALAAEGVDLDIRVYNDYILPNRAVEEGDIDANYFQHDPYLKTYNANNGTDIISVGGVHVEPMALYSSKVKRLEDLKEGAKIVVPSDPTNGGRALLLLQAHGLIKLKIATDLLATPRDIIDNPKKLSFTTADAPIVARLLPDVDLAVINSNFAMQAGLNPVTDSLLIEGSESPYVNIVATVPSKKDDPRIQKLMKALQSADTAKFIEETYQGAVVPVYKAQ